MGESVFASKGHFPRFLRCRRPCGCGSAELLQLLGAEDELADGRLAAAEDEVVGAEPGDLDLRLLDREEVLDRLRQRAVPVLERRLELAQLVLGLASARAGGGCRCGAPPRRRTAAGRRRRCARRSAPGGPRRGAAPAARRPPRSGARRRARSRPRRRGPTARAPSSSPAPRISRSRIAIAKPAPSSVWSASVASRARASGVSSRASG